MADDATTRKLATIVALDVAGYSALAEADEARTTAELVALRKVIEAIATRHGGRVFSTAGDGFMLEFASSLSGVEAAIELADTCEPKVRVGVHLSDVLVQANGDLLGHGVNVAARLMAQSAPGSVLVSADVKRAIRGPVAERLRPSGILKLDKMTETVEAFALTLQAAPAPSLPVVGVGTRSDAIAIAVIPFQAISTDPIDTSLARGLSIEIGNALGRVGRLCAVSNVATGEESGTVDLRAVARDWHAQYAVTGSLIRRKAQYRILAQLVRIDDGLQIWSDTYSESDANLFEIQGLIAETIVRQIGGEVMRSEYARISRLGASDANAWALTAHSAHVIIERRGGPKAWDEAIAIVERAISMAPDYGAAHARLAALCGERIIMLASPDVRSDRQRALESAKRAIELSGHDPYTLMNAAQGLALCGESERANRMLTRALKALPHDLLCWLFYWSSRAQTAPESELPDMIDALNRAIDTYPAHPLTVAFRGTAGVCHLKLGHFPKARSILQECVDDAPGFSFWGVALASVHALEGNAGLSRRVLEELASQRFRADREYLQAAGEVSVIKPYTDVLLPIM